MSRTCMYFLFKKLSRVPKHSSDKFSAPEKMKKSRLKRVVVEVQASCNDVYPHADMVESCKHNMLA